MDESKTEGSDSTELRAEGLLFFFIIVIINNNNNNNNNNDNNNILIINIICLGCIKQRPNDLKWSNIADTNELE